MSHIPIYKLLRQASREEQRKLGRVCHNLAASVLRFVLRAALEPGLALCSVTWGLDLVLLLHCKGHTAVSDFARLMIPRLAARWWWACGSPSSWQCKHSSSTAQTCCSIDCT